MDGVSVAEISLRRWEDVLCSLFDSLWAERGSGLDETFLPRNKMQERDKECKHVNL